MKIPELDNLIRAFKRGFRVFIAGFCSSMAILMASSDITNWKAFLTSVIIGGISGGLTGISKLLRDDQDIDLKII